MTAKEAFQKITGGGSSDFAKVIGLCETVGDYCLIGGLAVNCYVEPVYTLDADLVIHTANLQKIRQLLKKQGFKIEDHRHSLNAVYPKSELRIQFTKDERYQSFPARSKIKKVLEIKTRVADLSDIVQGKIWAWSDSSPRLSKRQKDQADLIRIAEEYPKFKSKLPSQLKALFY